MVDLNLRDFKDALEDENNDLDFINLTDDKTIIAFKSTNYHTSFLNNLKEFQENEKLCDIVLRTQSDPGKHIRAHKIVLACTSPYFRAMFAGGFKEDKCCHEIMVEQISFNILETIVEFIYTSKIIVRETNVEFLLPAAKMLQIDDIVRACCMYLRSNMDPNNCISIAEFAKVYGCVNLVKHAQLYLKEHFIEVTQSTEFLNLNKNQLCKIISDDELGVPCETIVFKAVCNWVKFDPENRRGDLDNIFRFVRFHCLPPQFIRAQLNDEIFKDTEEQKKFMQKVIRDLEEHNEICQAVQQRKPAMGFCLYVIGGYQRQSSINLVEYYNKTKNKWEKCAELNTPRSGVTCVAYFLYIYAIGGRNNSVNGNTDCADVEVYDPFLNIWKRRSFLNLPRSRASCAVLDGYIYVMGGAHGANYHSSVERYHEEENKWEFIMPMNVSRIGSGCAVVNRIIYVVGGYDGVNRLSSVECYNPETNLWSFVQPLNIARSGAGVCSLNNYIYAVGGYTTNLQLNSAERYDVNSNQWTFIASMESPRSALACVSWLDRIVAIGGYNGTEFLSSIEIYDHKNDKWEKTTPLTSERSGHGAAVTVEVNKIMMPTYI